MAINIHNQIERLLRRQVRLRSLCKRNDEQLAALYRALCAHDGQPRYLPEPPVNDVDTDDELVEEVRKRMRRVGYVPKVKK